MGRGDTAEQGINNLNTRWDRMLLLKGVPKAEIKKLKIGDFFVDSEIVNIQRKPKLVSIVTRAGSVFNAHWKSTYFNVFKKVKRPPEKRENTK
jgi:hypothetical protein